ncbi:MAG: tRNA threonylcarbamoyladenosine dehydratase [Erysipelotrichaceae bacterium]|nr:tRNA threonylcarbamoyladenosine dehydratase [Erysipelotrichaceae bacterium]
MNDFRRLALILTEGQLNKLINSTVMVVGIGGVGAMACEALARSAVGHLIIIDSDQIQRTNINRQIHTLQSTIGRKKVDVMEERIQQINPACQVTKYDLFFTLKEKEIFNRHIDYVIDAIDTVGAKLDLIELCHQNNVPCVSCLGMGNRLDPSLLSYTQLMKTAGDPLAKALRIQARKRGIDYPIDVVFSQEQPTILASELMDDDNKHGHIPPGSSAFVPNAAGLFLASFVVRHLSKGS